MQSVIGDVSKRVSDDSELFLLKCLYNIVFLYLSQRR